MGSLMPFGAMWSSLPFVLWVAVFTLVLMIPFLLQVPSKLLRKRHQIRWLSRFGLFDFDRLRLFIHLRDFDVLEHLLDALIHLAQRLANRAAVALIALAAHGDA